MENPLVLLETPAGEILVELYPDKAPESVRNFLEYVDEGFYDGTLFHRVIKGFMIQGGGLTFSMEEKPAREAIANEANNGLSNVEGSLAMAREPEAHSARAQFFINVADNSDIDYRDDSDEGFGYCVFGQVVDGMDAVTKIAKSKTRSFQGFDDVPVDPVSIIAAYRFE